MSGQLETAKDLIVEINATITELDDAIKEKAFDVLTAAAFGGKHARPKGHSAGGAGGSTPTGEGAEASIDTDDLAEFVSKHDTNKPADNVKVLFAYLFSQYGKVPFTLDEIRKLADEAGLTIPDRLDMTLKGGKAEGRSIYQAKGGGKYQLTAHGETFMKSTYSVSKGKKPRPSEESE